MNDQRNEQPDEIFACPACGYRMWETPIGSYEFCSLCGWQDDACQRLFPFSAVGANHVSLFDYQKELRQRESKGELRPGDRERDPAWRWLNASDRAFFSSGEPTTGVEYFHATDDTASQDDYEYWRRLTQGDG